MSRTTYLRSLLLITSIVICLDTVAGKGICRKARLAIAGPVFVSVSSSLTRRIDEFGMKFLRPMFCRCPELLRYAPTNALGSTLNDAIWSWPFLSRSSTLDCWERNYQDARISQGRWASAVAHTESLGDVAERRLAWRSVVRKKGGHKKKKWDGSWQIMYEYSNETAEFSGSGLIYYRRRPHAEQSQPAQLGLQFPRAFDDMDIRFVKDGPALFFSR